MHLWHLGLLSQQLFFGGIRMRFGVGFRGGFRPTLVVWLFFLTFQVLKQKNPGWDMARNGVCSWKIHQNICGVKHFAWGMLVYERYRRHFRELVRFVTSQRSKYPDPNHHLFTKEILSYVVFRGTWGMFQGCLGNFSDILKFYLKVSVWCLVFVRFMFPQHFHTGIGQQCIIIGIGTGTC